MKSLPPIVHRGSVKNIRREENADYLFFEYTDGYSVFDWGTMPDMLEGKGQALAVMADAFFDLLGSSKSWKEFKFADSIPIQVRQQLKQKGLRHHGLGLVEGHPSSYKVRAVDVLRPTPLQYDGALSWDYSLYESRPQGALVPLEVIFRFGIPTGSSFLERAKNKDYCASLGLEREVGEGDVLAHPIIEYSSKLETTDRYMDTLEAARIACLREGELERLHGLSMALAYRLKEIFEDLGIFLWDGKFEFAFVKGEGDERDFMLVDSIGPDELRLSYDGVGLSKQNLRNFYRGGRWHGAVGKAKDMAKERGVTDWKRICAEELGEVPPRLDRDVLEGASMMYKSLANELVGKFFSRQAFPGSWDLGKTAREMGRLS